MGRKMKRNLQWLLAVLTAGMLTGCGVDFPELESEEQAQVAEYTAGLILKYDKNYHSNLLDGEELAEAVAKKEQEALKAAALEEAAAAEKAAAEKAKEEASGQPKETAADLPKTLTEIMAIEGIAFRYTGYEILKEYPSLIVPGEVAFAVSASPGKKLLVLKVEVTNQGSADYELDMLQKGTGFRVGWNGEKARKGLATMLLDDLTVFNGVIAAGQTISTVIVSEVPEENADGIQSVELSVKDGEGNHKVLLE